MKNMYKVSKRAKLITDSSPSIWQHIGGVLSSNSLVECPHYWLMYNYSLAPWGHSFDVVKMVGNIFSTVDQLNKSMYCQEQYEKFFKMLICETNYSFQSHLSQQYYTTFTCF